jgi:hypothetical protein
VQISSTVSHSSAGGEGELDCGEVATWFRLDVVRAARCGPGTGP